MKRVIVVLIAVFSLWLGAASAQEHESHGSKVVSTPQWESVKSLVGEWDGYTMEGDKKYPAHISVRMTGDGSAVMHWMGAETPHEMITMFHMDKENLLATHYCAAHNQPRFQAVVSADPKKVVLEFKDGTNIRPGDGYMRSLAITFVDPDHHNEDWGYEANGKVETATFYMTRIKVTSNP
ncbi:MAG: hypothetical protein A2Y78_06065 [Acidobacteria bacterium RBG_13_68_16]|nr:MAG: hypothetical protein A2Y78_06065 [Acidobacteria bacterium RBG_13_68_16]